MMRVMIFCSDDPPADVRKAGELARHVLANEHLSQVARLANWLMSFVLVQEKDFDGALTAANKTVALAPYDTFMLSSLMIGLVEIGGDRIRRFSGLTRLRAVSGTGLVSTTAVGDGRIWYWYNLETR